VTGSTSSSIETPTSATRSTSSTSVEESFEPSGSGSGEESIWAVLASWAPA
jgi:hypothetical protein